MTEMTEEQEIYIENRMEKLQNKINAQGNIIKVLEEQILNLDKDNQFISRLLTKLEGYSNES